MIQRRRKTRGRTRIPVHSESLSLWLEVLERPGPPKSHQSSKKAGQTQSEATSLRIDRKTGSIIIKKVKAGGGGSTGSLYSCLDLSLLSQLTTQGDRSWSAAELLDHRHTHTHTHTHTDTHMHTPRGHATQRSSHSETRGSLHSGRFICSQKEDAKKNKKCLKVQTDQRFWIRRKTLRSELFEPFSDDVSLKQLTEPIHYNTLTNPAPPSKCSTLQEEVTAGRGSYCCLSIASHLKDNYRSQASYC